METAPGIDDIRAAWARIAAHVHRTPVLRSRTLDARSGAEVLLKCEHLQRTGAFKARGALNAVLSLPAAELAGGVATHSSGNHAAALALAASVRGVTARIVMPRTVPAVKQAAVQGYGGEIEFCEPTLAAREAGLRALVDRTGAAVVHPYDDWRVIAGQGTAVLELLEEHPGLEAIVTPLGGGGLLSGTAIAAKALRPAIRVIGVEPAGADDGARGFRSGIRVTGSRPDTIADGLRGELGERGFQVIRALVDDVFTVTDAAIIDAMRFTWERTKQLVEPSAATVIAALLDGRLQGLRVGAILSGGNCDLDDLPWRPR
ncbi:MAG: pyridoxal-phosphate dependent enzyme [Xanthomonadaceae bacterium]|nr:pyridoxal-phosphate dependent enzyme [Xanthomonadaceae bacterium]